MKIFSIAHLEYFAVTWILQLAFTCEFCTCARVWDSQHPLALAILKVWQHHKGTDCTVQYVLNQVPLSLGHRLQSCRKIICTKCDGSLASAQVLQTGCLSFIMCRTVTEVFWFAVCSGWRLNFSCITKTVMDLRASSLLLLCYWWRPVVWALFVPIRREPEYVG